MYVHIGYFENFKGANTILVCGDGDGLQRLTAALSLAEALASWPPAGTMPACRPAPAHSLLRPACEVCPTRF